MHRNLTTIHTLPLQLLDELLKVYTYQGFYLDDLFEDVWRVLEDTPDRLLHHQVFDRELSIDCGEMGLSYPKAHKEYLLLLNWLHLSIKPHLQDGWVIIDIGISENFDVICHYKPSWCGKENHHRVAKFRYTLQIPSLRSNGVKREECSTLSSVDGTDAGSLLSGC